MATALSYPALKWRHDQARRRLSHLAGQCGPAGLNSALGCVTHWPGVGAGHAIEAGQALAGVGQLATRQRLGRRQVAHPLGGLLGPAHSHGIPSHQIFSTPVTVS